MGDQRLARCIGFSLVCWCAVTSAQTPWERHAIDVGSRGADGVRLADANGDGRLDVATGWEEGGAVRVCLNPGPDAVRAPWPGVTVGEVDSPEDAVLVDVDGDGAVDVVTACEGDVRCIFIHWAPGNPDRYLDSAAWNTVELRPSKGKTRWMFCLPMDVDGRHAIDIAAGAKGSGANVGWFESPADPRNTDAWQWHSLTPAGWIMSLQAVDMNSDGLEDILVTDRKGLWRGCFWLQHPGRGDAAAGSWEKHYIGGRDKELMFLAVGDVNGDSEEDIVVAVRGQELLSLHKEGHGQWSEHIVPLPDNTGTGKGVAIADINLDGDNDMVFTCEHAFGKCGAMWLSHDNGQWVGHNISGVQGIKFDRIELLDLDDDGDLDLMTCEEAANLGVVWYENPTLEPEGPAQQ